ncbi:alpha/beta fold hydrolase [Tsuneonella amylolytica]|uniref:alpha/beta fold hydrolase n=1 Tax=Tsuneonella amylolytica TaxID=2338327 RepID=UPI000EA85635|nr:alpha/beta fold hydrolase [Tsuneonella amylolytica]
MEPIGRPALFLLHALGMSSREWDRVVAELGDAFECHALDIPGFGDAAGDPRRSVEEMADWLADEIRACDPANWMIAGHSMGGKLATLIAARTANACRATPTASRSPTKPTRSV